MITLDTFDTVTYLKTTWFANFIQNNKYPPDEELQERAAEWGGKFRWHYEGEMRTLLPNWLDFEDERDATIFLLRWS